MMRYLKYFLVAIAALLPFSLVVKSQIIPARLSTAPPKAIARQASANAPSSQLTVQDGIYYFTITLPKQSAQRFAKLSFSFTDETKSNGLAAVQFDLTATKGFLGAPGLGGQEIAIEQVWIDETGILWVSLNPTLSAGTNFTIALKAKPASLGAEYGYGIAAYPEAQNQSPILVGNGIFK
uniref:DUF2808 domain-containing protein n=1 Tax=Oscillatoriales cyanobacterium SpSt-418 TaxID=2282169 RepID=A0A7C3PHH1_9CYAN